MIPVIDFKAPDVLDQIREAYTTVGFAVFTNALSDVAFQDMKTWQEQMKAFFALPDDVKRLSLIHISSPRDRG